MVVPGINKKPVSTTSTDSTVGAYKIYSTNERSLNYNSTTQKESSTRQIPGGDIYRNPVDQFVNSDFIWL